MTEHNWVFEGDEVAVRSGQRGDRIEFVRVERLTATLVVLVDGRRYSRRDLREWGSKGSTCIADPRRKDVVEDFARQQLRAFARASDVLVSGSGATVQGMDVDQVRATLADLAAQLGTIREELDQRAGA